MSNPEVTLNAAAARLAQKAATITAASTNEANLRHELENALEEACGALGIPWTPFTLDLTLKGAGQPVRFIDVAHGAVLIEYEPPISFGGAEGAIFRHAKSQVEEYAVRIHEQEGRPLPDYVLAVWDGSHIAFGAYDTTTLSPTWERLSAFNQDAGKRLLLALQQNGRPLVHPLLLSAIVGPESDIGHQLQPAFFDALIRLNGTAPGTATTKTKLLFTEWKRLFGQVVGVQSELLRDLLERQGRHHGRPYDQKVAEYFFGLNTYIALLAKLIAALALPGASRDITDSTVPLHDRLTALENGSLFASAGIANMLVGDFFSWYIDDPSWGKIEPAINAMLLRLSTVNFDVTRKSATSTRDLFKGLYETFVPRELRHALGEVYTPDWLAAHALDAVGWQPENDLLDPTCGTGTFLLEAVKRRLERQNGNPPLTAEALLLGIHGIDLNPLAVLAARASLVVYLAPTMRPDHMLRLPVYLADAVNAAEPAGGYFEYTLQTELGFRRFVVPEKLVRDIRFHDLFSRLRDLVNANLEADDILGCVIQEYNLTFDDNEQSTILLQTIAALVDLHKKGWNGIWCPILADRFAAGAIGTVSHICGNPPWVKWSHLPPDYAEFIKPHCLALGVFSQDRWVGGIESDISTVITYQSVRKWLAPNGVLAFFITGTVFANESSEGFRRFGQIGCDVVAVEDFQPLSPFDGVTNHPTLLILKKRDPQRWPVPYRVWQRLIEAGRPVRSFKDAAEFRARVAVLPLLAAPVPGTIAGPWLKGNQLQHDEWNLLFDASKEAIYKARKGVTTDANGVFFVRPTKTGTAGLVRVENDPSIGRRDGLPVVNQLVETEHVFPLLRGRGTTAFSAEIDPEFCVIVPQRSMHGDPALPKTAPRTYTFLHQFKGMLETRSSLKRFQKGQPWWSLWSTGVYTFAPYKVLWREMAGGNFAAAYIGPVDHPILGTKLPIADHKLYFVPLDTEDAAAFLAAILNAPRVALAIGAYAAQLSLGVSVVEYLQLPAFDPLNTLHVSVAQLGKDVTAKKLTWDQATKQILDDLVDRVLHEHRGVATAQEIPL